MNVAEERILMRRGHEVRTGLWKLPAEGRVPVGELGLEGDFQGDRRLHGGRDKAVYAYAEEDLRWWEEQLGRELGAGFFGENLTLRGVEVNGARVGERWQVGTTLLQTTEPRGPCWKLQEKVGERLFVRRFAQAGRPGAYLRVVRPGDVGAGDAVRVLSSPAGAATIAALAAG